MPNETRPEPELHGFDHYEQEVKDILTAKARRLTLPEVRCCGCGIAKQLESIEQAICHLESNWWDGKAIHERPLLDSIKARLTEAKRHLEDLGEMGPHDGPTRKPTIERTLK